MITCWLCGIDLPTETEVGQGKNICPDCNRVYTMVCTIYRLKPEEIHKRIKKQERTLALHKLVRDKDSDERPHETAKKFLEGK